MMASAVAAACVLAAWCSAAAAADPIPSGSVIAPDGKVVAKPGEVEEPKGPGLRLRMTKEEVLATSMGKPLEITETETPRGVRERWVYPGNKYLYFMDGVLVGAESVRR
jgi:hypothetical protein